MSDVVVNETRVRLPWADMPVANMCRLPGRIIPPNALRVWGHEQAVVAILGQVVAHTLLTTAFEG